MMKSLTTTVQFYNDEITAVLVQQEGGEAAVYIPIRPICDALGVDWSSQRQRIGRDEILSDVIMSVVVTTTDIDPSSQRPRTSEMLALPLDFLNGFLFGINASRVKPEIKPRLLRYQRECYRVLAEAWRDGQLSINNPPLEEMLATGSEVAEAYKMLQAMVKLAHNQLVIEFRQHQQQELLDDHEKRLSSLEVRFKSTEVIRIDEEQASQLSQAVKAVAIEMGKKSGRNEFGGVYGELYRRYGIGAYRMLPLEKFEDAMSWLGEWYQQLTD